jgi:ABC-2 type transport system permease protein
MRSIRAALFAETLKLRRSGIFWITVILFIVIPLMMSFMMFVSENPETAKKLGLIGTKASLFGGSGWVAFFGLLLQSIATVGLIGFGFVTSWVFGREYTERTLKDITALPVSRTSIVIAKFIVVFAWCTLLLVILYVTGLITGSLIGLSGWQDHTILILSKKYFATAFLTIVLCPPVAFFAYFGRGILLPLGFVIITMIMAQFIGLVGLGPYFPWAIPGVNIAPPGTPGMQLVTASWIILSITGLTGLFGTIWWFNKADQY